MSTLQTTNLKHPDAVGNQITFASDGSSAVSGDVNFDSGSAYIDSTNNRLGVGTVSPAQSLHLKGGYLRIDDASQSLGTLHIGAENGVNTVYSQVANGGAGAQPLRIVSGNSSESLRVDGSGRLMVGTSTYAGNGKVIAAGHVGGNTGTLDIVHSGSRPTAFDNDIGYLRWMVAENSSANAQYATIYATTDGGSSSTTDIPGRLVFATTPDSSTSPVDALMIDRGGMIRGLSSQGLQLNGYNISLNNTWVDLDDWSTVSNKAAGGSIIALSSNHTGTTSGKVSLTHHYIRYDGGLGHSIQVQTQFPFELRTDNGKLQGKGFDSGTGLNTSGYVTLIYSDSRRHIEN